jgi:short-subunit dehydrogenase
MAESFDLHGARVLLTGATGGIGHAIARDLRAQGAELILTGRRVDVLEPLAKELDARSLPADLEDLDSVDRLVAEAGPVDVLVANAALPGSGALLDFTPEQIHRALTVNLEAPIRLARATAASMVDHGRGHIVLIGSVAGKAASPSASMYNATKFGLRGFALGFREDLRGTGVGVSIVEPGFVREAGMFVEGGGKLPKGVRTVSPDDVAAGVRRAIERNRGEVVVAPVEMRIGAGIGSLFPELSATVQRKVGGGVMESLTEGQRDKR